MKDNTVYSENEGKLNVANVKLCFENLNSRTYKPGHLVVERQLARESENSPLRKLAEFADVIVDNCEINESSKNGMTIYVSAVASGEDKMQKMYEWLKTYAGEDKVEELAPDLMESLGIKSDNEDNSVASRFAKYRKLYEEESVTEDDSVTEDNKEEDEKTSDNEDNSETDDNGEEGDKDDKGDDEEEEQDELTAVIIEVAKGDEDKAKDELIEAGVDEDDIEILSDEENKDDDKKEDDEQNEVITFFVTDDSNHLPVRLDMYLKFGSAKVYLTNYSGLKNPIGAQIKQICAFFCNKKIVIHYNSLSLHTTYYKRN